MFPKKIKFFENYFAVIFDEKIHFYDYFCYKIVSEYALPENLINFSQFNDCLFGCSDKQAYMLPKNGSVINICSVGKYSQIICLTIERLGIIKFDKKGNSAGVF